MRSRSLVTEPCCSAELPRLIVQTAVGTGSAAARLAGPRHGHAVVVHRAARRDGAFYRAPRGRGRTGRLGGGARCRLVRTGDESAVVSVIRRRQVRDRLVIRSRSRSCGTSCSARCARAAPLRLHFAGDRSARRPPRGAVGSTSSRTGSAMPGISRRSHAGPLPTQPPEFGGPLDNAYSDTPLVAWHEATASATPGTPTCSTRSSGANERRTNTPAADGRWGRSTDIEWIYGSRWTRTATGCRAVTPTRRPTTSRRTSTAPTRTTSRARHLHVNNNICDTVNDPIAVLPVAQETLRPAQPREHIMDPIPGRIR